jgi:branched-chain amino acid transport system permease protein
MRYVARYRELLVLLVIAAVLGVLVSGSRLFVYNMTIVAIFSITVIGLNLITGRAGQVSFAQTSFMAVGGYGLALLTTRLHWNPWLAMAAGVGLSAAAALVIGVPLLRLRGHYLAMGTFALALGTSSLAAAAPFTGGAIGISGVPPLTIGEFSSVDLVSAYEICWAFCGVSLLLFAALNSSYVGRAWRSIALREEVAASLGVNLHGYKTLAFVLAAVLASISGSLYVAVTNFVSPDVYDAGTAITLFVILFIGGRGALFGPLLGSMIVVLGPQLFSGISAWQNAVFFALLLLVIMFRPQGLLGGAPARPPWAGVWRAGRIFGNLRGRTAA